MHFSVSITLIVTLLSVALISVFAIEDGEEVTDPSAYPFYVMLGNPHVCGGIIISFNPAIVITAAHCVADAPHPRTLSPNPYFVGYGHPDRKQQTINPIVDWVVHPEYDNSNGEINMHHDLAIVKLQKSLKPSDKIDRIALWSANQINIPRQATLMGYGYTRVDEPEARNLQRISLNVTKFTAGYSDMVEAISAQDSEKACHGDSGSPLIVYQEMDESTLLPVAVGLLARIFGVYDGDTTHATCPIPFRKNSKVPTVIESFCNLSSMLLWISEEAGIAIEDLTDPMFVPNSTCYEDCLGRWKGSRSESDEDNGKPDDQWHIGFGDGTYQKNHPDKWWIGPVVQQGSSATNINASLYLLLLTTIVVSYY